MRVDDMIDGRMAANQACFRSGAWENTRYRGVPVFKYPEDLWVYQELIEEIQPTVIVETGTCQGGSALYFQDLLDRLPDDDRPRRRVVTVDISDQVAARDPRIHYVVGDSTHLDTLVQVERQLSPDDVVMVCLDSEHLEEHVFAELQMYAALVTAGSYLVVEDTFISRYGCQGERFQDGSSWEALQRWLPDHPEFEYDPSRDKFLLSMNPGGWLRRKT